MLKSQISTPPELRPCLDAYALRLVRLQNQLAVRNLKSILKPGDRIGCTHCPGPRRVFTFQEWAGDHLMSQSGDQVYHPSTVYSINGTPVDPLYLNHHQDCSDRDTTVPKTLPFSSLPLGTRFQYPGSSKVWTILRKIQKNTGGPMHGTVAQWEPDMLTYGLWPGQSICAHIPLSEGGDCPEDVIPID